MNDVGAPSAAADPVGEGRRWGPLQPLLEHRQRLAPLGLVLLISFAYFVAAPAWNQNSRLALTRALVEERTTVIDTYAVTTGDKSLRDGHFYCDKAPGTSWVAAPVYAVFYAWRRSSGAELPDVSVHSLDPRLRLPGHEPDPDARKPGDVLVYNQAHRWALYLCGLFAVAIPSVFAAACTFVVALRWSSSTTLSTRVAVAYALGTPAFVYSTALYGHQLCAALLVGAFALVVCGRTDDRAWVPWVAGSLLGLAVVTEYPSAPIAALLVVVGARHGRRYAARMVAGGAPWAVLLAAYHTAAFGHPLRTGYDFVYRAEFAEGMRVAYGLGLPDPAALWQITFGSYRGLFHLSPMLILAAWGLVSTAIRSRRNRVAAATAIAIVAYLVLLNAGYYMWDGGAAAGPRHVVPALAFLALGLVRAFRVVPRATTVLAVVSVAQALLSANASPEAAQFGDPLWEFAIDRLLYRVPGPEVTSTNVGLLLGLPGPLSLVPLLALWWWGWPHLRERREVSTPDAEPSEASRPATGSQPAP